MLLKNKKLVVPQYIILSSKGAILSLSNSKNGLFSDHENISLFRNDKELMRICKNGDIYIGDEIVSNNIETVYGIREVFKKMESKYRESLEKYDTNHHSRTGTAC
jgi:hypothetical protein